MDFDGSNDDRDSQDISDATDQDESEQSPTQNKKQKHIRPEPKTATQLVGSAGHSGSERVRKHEPQSGKLLGSGKKDKLMIERDAAETEKADNYSPHDVVEKMLMKRDRKIPGSVFKPHSEEIVLLQSVALGQP